MFKPRSSRQTTSRHLEQLESRIAMSINVGGSIFADTDWNRTDEPYVLTDDLTIESGATLRIHPNVTVITPANRHDIFVRGTLDATNASFLENTDIKVRSGGTANLRSGSLVDGTGIHFEPQSRGNVTGSHFRTAALTLTSSSVSISQNRFDRLDPIYVSPSLVDEIYDNQVAGDAAIMIGGRTSGNTTLRKTGSVDTFQLVDDIRVVAGNTMNVENDVTVVTPTNRFDIFVNGVLNSSGATFVGNTEIQVERDGEANIGNSTRIVEGLVQFHFASQGSVTNSDFDQSGLRLYSSEVNVDRNDFNANIPISATPSEVGELYDNSFVPGTTILVRGRTTGDVAWNAAPNITRFQLQDDVIVEPGHTLSITRGVVVDTPNRRFDFFVNGALVASNATFTGSSDVQTRRDGHTSFHDVDFNGDEIHLLTRSRGTFEDSKLNASVLLLNSSATIHAQCNDLTGATVEARGSAFDTINLEENYWGTTDPQEIEARIYDHSDDPRLPIVDYDPFLSSPECGPPPEKGDLNRDGNIDILDVDLLCRAIRNGSSAPEFNLDEMGDVGLADLDYMIMQILGTTVGDANLDGVFNSSDLILVFTEGEYEDGTEDNSTWASGDWNCDGEFDTSDLVRAFQADGYRG